MKIVYLHQYFATPKSNGGTRSYEMAKRLVQQGHSVTMITTSAFLQGQYAFSKGWNRINIDGIDVHIYHLPYSNNDGFLKRIYKFIAFSLVSTRQALRHQGDVLFATSTPLTIAIPALIYKKVKKVPFVFEVRDLWPDVPIAMGIINNKLAIKLLKLFEKYTYRQADQIIALSTGMARGVKECDISNEKITVIPNSCDTALFDIDASHGENFKKTHLSFVGKRKLVVYAGTFGLVNRVDYLVELAEIAKQQDSPICFVAIGTGNCKQQVVDLAKERGVLDKNLHILEPIAKVELTNLLSAADLCLSLVGPVKAFWDNSANKVFDALAAQTPIAINHQGWQKEFIEQSGCGLVLDDDYVKSLKRLTHFLHDDKQYNDAVAACKSLSYERFSRDKLATQFAETLVKAKNG